MALSGERCQEIFPPGRLGMGTQEHSSGVLFQ